MVMSRIAVLLDSLDAAARSRVLAWANGAFAVQDQKRTAAKLTMLPRGVWNDRISSRNDASAIGTQLGFSADVEDWLFGEQDYSSN
jgi:hypothetical protein